MGADKPSTNAILEGTRAPIGAQLRLGRKNAQKGYPELNDRFFIVSPHESEATFGSRKGTVKKPLPEFQSFNGRSEREPITVFRGELVHANRADAWHYERRAQQLPGKEWPNHPNRRAACTSQDGVKATRLYGIGDDGAEDWKEIDCPGRQCEFSQEWDSGKKDRQGKPMTFRPCKVSATLLFVPRWKDDNLPAPLMKWCTGSWASAEAVEGFFNFIEERAHEMGLDGFSFMGIPFILTVTKKTQPKQGRSFPVVSMAPDGDLINAFIVQRQNLELAGGERLELPAVTDRPQEIVDADATDVTCAVPGQEGLFDAE